MRRVGAFLLLLGLGASQVAATACPMGAAPSAIPEADVSHAHRGHAAHAAPAPGGSVDADHDRHDDRPAPDRPDQGCVVLVGCGTAVMAAAGAPDLAPTGAQLDIDVTPPAHAGLTTFLSADPPPPRLPV